MNEKSPAAELTASNLLFVNAIVSCLHEAGLMHKNQFVDRVQQMAPSYLEGLTPGAAEIVRANIQAITLAHAEGVRN